MDGPYCRPPRFVHSLGVYSGAWLSALSRCCLPQLPSLEGGIDTLLDVLIEDGWDASSADAFRYVVVRLRR